MAAGYSGTPLVKKLGIKPGQQLAFIDEPPGFRRLLDGLEPGAAIRTTARGKADTTVAFFIERSELKKRLPALGRAIFPDGALWVAWPKRASKVPTDVTEDVVREMALPIGLVDVKVCAIDDVWSGLKVVWRTSERG